MELAFDIRGVFQPADIYPQSTGFGKLASDVLVILTGTAGALSLMFIPSEKTPAFMPEMKRILSEEERTTAFRPWESIFLI